MWCKPYQDLARVLLVLGVGDLAVVVEDHGPTSALNTLALRTPRGREGRGRDDVLAVSHAGSPSMLLGEEGLGVAEEQLHTLVSDLSATCFQHIQLTRSSPLTPLTLPQAFMTHASFDAMTATMSTPLPFSSPSFSMYGGRWRAWQPGVNAPMLYYQPCICIG